MGIIQHKSGIYYRPEESDRYVIAQANHDYRKVVVGKDDVVLDLGANIGCFAHRAVASGARKVVCVEPIAETCEVLRMNVPTAAVFNAAAVYDRAKKDVAIFMSKSAAMCSVFSIKGRDSRKVVTVQIDDLYAEFAPTIVKMDVESAEYELLRAPVPLSVRQMGVEFSFRKPEHDPLVVETYRNLRQQGFIFDGHPDESMLFPPGDYRASVRTRAKTYYLYR